MAATVSIEGDMLTVVMQGLDKLWSLKSEHDRFERLVIEVDDPSATVQLIERAIAGRAGSADR